VGCRLSSYVGWAVFGPTLSVGGRPPGLPLPGSPGHIASPDITPPSADLLFCGQKYLPLRPLKWRYITSEAHILAKGAIMLARALAINAIFIICITGLSSLFYHPLSAQELVIIDHKKGNDYGQQWGDRCEGLGDINGDGYSDFLVTEFPTHLLYLYLGGPNPFDNPPVLTWENHGWPTGIRSFSPVNVGDVDCDGVNDFITVIGENDTLKLFLGLEKLDPNDNKVIFADGSVNWSWFNISGGGDNNGDGNKDFWFFNEHGSSNDTIWGFSGCAILDTLADFRIYRDPNPDGKYYVIAQQLVTNYDLNGDGADDVVYGQTTSYPGYPGRVSIVWGREDLPHVPDLVFYSPDAETGGTSFGFDLAGLSDISGDGIDDLWVNQWGRNYIYFGGQPFDTIPDLIVDWPYISFDPVDNVGDINDDSYDDIMLIMDDYLYSYVSFIYCYPGMDTLIDASWSDDDYYYALLDGPICCLGLDHSWVGDINGDGRDDILLAPRETALDHQDAGRIIIQSGWSDPVAADDEEPLLPQTFSMEQNHPNPFNSSTTIEFSLERYEFVEIKIFNLLGQQVATPLAESLPAGDHQMVWDGLTADGTPAPSGIYLYQIITEDFAQAKKMLLLK
jgi:hypothetical protein